MGKKSKETLLNGEQNVGYVPQDHFLLNESIAKNICFGDDEPNLERLNFSIKNSELNELLRQLPKENTIVGDRGINFRWTKARLDWRELYITIKLF